MRNFRLALALPLASCLLLGAGAQALGAHVDSQASLVPHANYAVRTMTVANGVRVREYVAPSGVIFGVAWQGVTLPNLKQLLGARFAAFQAAAAGGSRRRGPLYVQVDGLVVENGGHMRGYFGRAYLTVAIPANLTAAVIQ